MNSLIEPKIGLLLVNLGTPNSTSIKDIKAYLKQFLSDPYVIDIPSLFRWLLVNGIILNFRPKKSQHAYKSIWTEKGSPLLVISLELEQKLNSALKKQGLNWETATGMRYGEPSVDSAIKKLLDKGVNQIIFLPLYPQYALSSTTTAEKEVFKSLENNRLAGHPILHNGSLQPFYKHPSFIKSLAESIKKAAPQKSYDHLLFSYHGLPERHVLKTDSSQSYCLKDNNCCATVTESNHYCYRAHCFSTTREVAQLLNIPTDQITTSFQSRLGSSPWIKPYTDQELIVLAKKGIQRLAVICPSFVTDCLETLEEINLRGREVFLANGGKEFLYIPCLNTDNHWISALIDISQDILKNAPQNTWSRFLD